MDKNEVLQSLKNMFENDLDKESDYIIENNQIDKNNYLTLITKDKDDFVLADPDFEAFINLLKFHNTKELNYIVNKLNDNKVKIFTEFSDAERQKFLNDVRDLYSRLSGSNSRNITFVELMIVDWANKLF